MNQMNNENDGPKWEALCQKANLTAQDREILACSDRRQNGHCGCIQRYILHKTEVLNPAFVKAEPHNEPQNRLLRIKTISDDAHLLKTERNPVAGRRYSNTFAEFVKGHREELTKYRLCKKAIASVLHCSLNFLYRDNNNKEKVVKRIEHFIDVPCCDKSCLRTLCNYHRDELINWRQSLEHKDAKGEDKRKVYFDLREHLVRPCLRAIGEITSLSKATLNNLSGKTREDGIKHALQGRKRNPSNKMLAISAPPTSGSDPRERTFSTHSNSSTISTNSNRLSVIKPLEDVKTEAECQIEVVESDEDHSPSAGDIFGQKTPRSRLMASTEDVAPIVAQIPIGRLPETPVSCAQPISPIMMVNAMQVSSMAHPSCITAIPEVPHVTSPNGTKRKRMPGLMPINSPISPASRSSDSPQLELTQYSDSEQSPDKKARPSPLTPSIQEATRKIYINSSINTPTITPHTPRNPVTPSNAAFIGQNTPIVNRFHHFFYPDQNGVKQETHLKT